MNRSSKSTICAVLLSSALLVFCPGVARAISMIPYSVGDPITGFSDILQVSMDPALLVSPDNTTPQIRTITEGGGESVTEEIDFTITYTTAFDAFNTGGANVYLVEPGANVTGSGPNNWTGFRSDQITLQISHDTGNTVTELHFTINSDQDPGTHDTVTGYLENGFVQDITEGFGFGTLADDYGIVVLAGSDVENTTVPEPATLMLLGFGLLGLGWIKRIKK